MIELVPLEAIAPDRVERLLDRAFGADRHARTAYRLREGTIARTGSSLAAIEDGDLIGSIQSWPVLFHGDDGRRLPLTMIGPVAVEPARQRDGIGRLLMAGALEALGDAPLMLIGDPEYYGRFFGFSALRTAGWRLPGPFEAHRLLARGDDVPGGTGEIAPHVAVTA